jgi:hypothetical protein
MWYSFDYIRMSFDLMLTSIRKPMAMAFARIIMLPISRLNTKWRDKRSDTIYRIEHTFQVCYMRGALNDRFDPELRRIYIDGTGGTSEQAYVYTPAEEQPIYLGNIYLRNSLEVQSTGADFLVYVPSELLETQIFEIRAEIDFYRLAGKNYLIIPI